jgi:hypothetical protein
MSNISISKIQQYTHEHKTWERLLDFFLQENTVLKTRLSQVLDQSNSKELLMQAEVFQHRFIVKDELINELRHDVNGQQKLLEHNDHTKINNRYSSKQEKLRNEMEYLEKDFALLKNEFNKYLSTGL